MTCPFAAVFQEKWKKQKKDEEKCWQEGGGVVLYLSAKRWDKRMTFEAQLEAREKNQ